MNDKVRRALVVYLNLHFKTILPEQHRFFSLRNHFIIINTFDMKGTYKSIGKMLNEEHNLKINDIFRGVKLGRVKFKVVSIQQFGKYKIGVTIKLTQVERSYLNEKEQACLQAEK